MEVPAADPPASSAIETAHSLWVIYRQLPDDAQDVFKKMIEGEEYEGVYTNANWLPLLGPTLDDLWGAPEEDYWDELYKQQHQHG